MKKILSVLLSLMIIIVSCNPDDENIQDPKPVTPPEYSMAPDFGNFQQANNRSQTIEHWLYSALNVSVYSTILYGGLAIPVAAFKATINQEPFFDTEAGVWTWENSFSANANQFSVRLTADVKNNLVNWTAYISNGGNVVDFVWFTGQSAVDGNSGSWTLYESPQNPELWLSSSWSRIQTDAAATFTVEKEGDAKGSYIRYGISENRDLDRSVEIHNMESNDHILVEWSEENKFGRVMSSSYFGNDDFHCWDENLQDTNCE